jgi:polyhydroxyalkanoate synthesis regulator phasin
VRDNREEGAYDARTATATKQDLREPETRIIEAMRDMQTEILRAMERFSRGHSARLRSIEIQTRTSALPIDKMSERITALEERVATLETRPPR